MSVTVLFLHYCCPRMSVDKDTYTNLALSSTSGKKFADVGAQRVIAECDSPPNLAEVMLAITDQASRGEYGMQRLENYDVMHWPFTDADGGGGIVVRACLKSQDQAKKPQKDAGPNVAQTIVQKFDGEKIRDLLNSVSHWFEAHKKHSARAIAFSKTNGAKWELATASIDDRIKFWNPVLPYETEQPVEGNAKCICFTDDDPGKQCLFIFPMHGGTVHRFTAVSKRLEVLPRVKFKSGLFGRKTPLYVEYAVAKSNWIYVLGDRSSKAELWRLDTNTLKTKRLAEFESSAARSIAVNDATVTVGLHLRSDANRKTHNSAVVAWDCNTGKQHDLFRENDTSVNAICYSKTDPDVLFAIDNNQLYQRNSNGTITNKRIYEESGHLLNGIAASNRGLVFISYEGKGWNNSFQRIAVLSEATLETQVELNFPSVVDSINAIDVSDQGHLAAGMFLGEVGVWEPEKF